MHRTFKTVLLIIFLGSSLVCFQANAQEQQEKTPAQLANEYITIAEEIMASTKAMTQARDMYVAAAQLDPTNIIANYKAGEFYLETIGKDQAAQYFERVFELDPQYRFDIFYSIGRSYQYAKDFDKALDYFNKYKSKLIANDGYRGRDKVTLSEVERRIYECQNGKEFIINPSHHSIVNIGTAINTEEDEYGPVLNANEDYLIFTSRRRDGNLNQNVALDNKPFEDVFFSRKVDGKWTTAKNIGETINHEFHDSNLALSADGDQLFLYKDVNNGDIYVSYRNGDTWGYPEPLNESINSESAMESSISISPDGQVLFFTSNRPGGYGSYDIYYSIKNPKGVWERSKNLGPVINTEAEEDSPFIDYDGKTLYFSSQGHKGMGGHDIFYSVYDSAKQEWSEPKNLGYPINTPDNDVYFVSTKDGERGYYASVREDGLGYTDIYMVTIQKEEDTEPLTTVADNTTGEIEEDTTEVIEEVKPVVLTVKVIDKETGEPLDAQVNFRRKSDNVVAGVNKQSTGTYEIKVKDEQVNPYQLSIEKSGYAFENTTINVPAASSEINNLTRIIELKKLSEGTKSVLRNIYFDFNRATFKQESYNELNKLEKMMSQNPNLKIEISGHTDNIGSAKYNKQLSQKRATAVKDFLVSKGIDPRRIEAKGYGEEQPLASNDDELEGRELNRRVEFEVIK